jgi:3-oxoacyl-[acyl-carrier-protein] synthase II
MNGNANRPRIVITGLGAVTPLGIGWQALWKAILAGKSGVSHITHFDATDFDVKIASEVKNWEPSTFMARKDSKRMDRFTQFAVAAAQMALEDAQFTVTPQNATRVGVLIGSGVGGLLTLEAEAKVLAEKGPGRVSPLLIPMMIADMASGYVSILTGAKGPNSTVVTACATGANAIGDAMEILRRGQADVMIAGSSEAAITPLAIAGFANSKAMTTTFNDRPEKASRPFDAERDGFVLGEGSGILILETLEHAERRGAPHIYAELVGYGMSADAYHIVQPAPEGEGVARAIQSALEDADLKPADIGYINAHATSTKLGDEREVQAYKSIFGDSAKSGKFAISSTKSMTGHLLGAAGSVEAIITALALENQILPPTINQETPDPSCDLDQVPNVPRNVNDLEAALSNNSGFGGHNAVLALRRWRS